MADMLRKLNSSARRPWFARGGIRSSAFAVGPRTAGMTDPTRPALMARIRGKGTRPERLVEAALRRFGLRFRRHQTVLPQFVPSWRDDSSRISGRP